MIIAIRLLMLTLVILLLCRAVGLEIRRFTGIEINVDITLERSSDMGTAKAEGIDI